MKRIVLLLLLSLLAAAVLAAQSDSTRIYQGFSGGMMLHAGWLMDGSSSDFAASGLTKGIGGALKVHLGQCFRIGTEGYVSTMGLKNDGYVRTGWSGLLLEGWRKYRKVSPYGGLTVGGGTMKSLYMFEGSSHDWDKEENAVYNKRPFFALDPYIGCEVAVTKKFRLSFKLDWLLAIRKEGILRPTGPRLYVGFLFGH